MLRLIAMSVVVVVTALAGSVAAQCPAQLTFDTPWLYARIVDAATGAPIPKARVATWADNPAIVARGVADADGMINLQPLDHSEPSPLICGDPTPPQGTARVEADGYLPQQVPAWLGLTFVYLVPVDRAVVGDPMVNNILFDLRTGDIDRLGIQNLVPFGNLPVTIALPAAARERLMGALRAAQPSTHRLARATWRIVLIDRGEQPRHSIELNDAGESGRYEAIIDDRSMSVDASFVAWFKAVGGGP